MTASLMKSEAEALTGEEAAPLVQAPGYPRASQSAESGKAVHSNRSQRRAQAQGQA
jgi:hypothetical protein